MADNTLGEHIDRYYASRCKWQPINIRANNDSHNPLKTIEKSFQSLSKGEKEKIQQDMYGGEDPMEESTEFVNEKLDELQREMNKLTIGFKKPYTNAIQQENEQVEEGAAASSTANQTTQEDEEEERHGDEDKSIEEEGDRVGKCNAGCKRYVSSREFHLMFLRSERFNARFAARRLARYFKEKLDLFGKEKLARRIKHSDLDDKDLSLLRSGRIAIPGITDRSGRLIVIGSRDWYRGGDGETSVNMKRAMFYLFQSWLEDHEESQKKGFVFISWQISPPDTNKSSSLLELHSRKPILDMVQRAMPLRAAAVHRCYNDSREHMVINFILLVMPSHVRRRYVLHCGPIKACMLNLLPYGIDIDALPLTADGNYNMEDIVQYVDDLLQKDEEK